MSRLVVLTAFTLVSTWGTLPKSLADYSPIGLFELIGMADSVVVGTIMDVREQTFILRVQETLLGDERTKLELLQFQDWACAWRWAPYRAEQTILAFLKSENGKLHLIGHGAESELHIVGDDVYCPFYSDLRSSVRHGLSCHQAAAQRSERCDH